MNRAEKVAKWLIEKHSFEPEDATEVAKDFLSLLDQQGEPVDIVFDGPPGPEAGRFVEVESPPGRSIRFGEWVERDDGYWVLRIHPPASREREALARKLALDVRRVGTNVGRCCRKLEPYDFELAVKTSRFWEKVEAQTDAILSEGSER